MPRLREISFTDASVNPESIASDRGGSGWLILEGEALAGDWDRHNFGCPRCDRDGEPCGNRYCLICDCAGADGVVEYPGLPIGYAMAPEWADPPSYGPATHPTKLENRRGRITLPDGHELS